MMNFWQNKNVFLTGHTGFKGGWLAIWLAKLGARVTGYSLPPTSSLNLFELARVDDCLVRSHLADIRNLEALHSAVREASPEIILHLAAQPLLRPSYREPVLTWSTNVMGTVNVLEASRKCPGVRAVLVVTTDKCYQNKEWFWGYRETDPLGGHDPYSASKAATELVVESYRKSFFSNAEVLVATARAGNVIGGGDWSEDRILPDAYRAYAKSEPLHVRSPLATRPWQHVLESLNGYLMLAEKLMDGHVVYADAFNFGPAEADNISVASMLNRIKPHWPQLSWETKSSDSLYESKFLYLDSSKARRLLNWSPVWELDAGLRATAEWYQAFHRNSKDAREITEKQIEEYLQLRG
jgi:CDP-glucose 4,6-dehydratase